MDGIDLELPLFLFATFAGAFVAGLSGFAFGLVAASIWLYILNPVQSASLIVSFGLLVQGYSVWKLRGTRLAKALALCDRRRARRPRRHDAPDLVSAGQRTRCGRHLPHSLCSLRVLSSEPQPDRGRRPDRRRRRRICQWRSCGPHRSCRHPRDNLVWIARLAQREAAGGLSADCGHRLSDDRGLAWCEGNLDGRDV